jgi:hypothetical protein
MRHSLEYTNMSSNSYADAGSSLDCPIRGEQRVLEPKKNYRSLEWTTIESYYSC